jgi:hypothetical protein
MDNIILFPVCLRVNGKWWHGCRAYPDTGAIKKAIPERDYWRIYKWEEAQIIRDENFRHREFVGGGSAA